MKFRISNFEIATAILPALLLLFTATKALGQVTGIANTKHNLSSTGPGTIKATTETQICVFCHTPHGANLDQPPLWNRNLSTATYTPYTSPSLQSSPGQPTTYSKLCLSCHDGTIAIGSVRNMGGAPTVVSGLEAPLPPGATLIGTNLTNDHPISFVFDQALRSADQELADPSLLSGPIKLYPGANPGVVDSVQCTSCHDPHEGRIGKFLRKSAMGQSDNLCLTCHQKPGWVGSTHESDTFFWPKNQTTTQVRDHSCFGCHTPHTVDGAERLLRNAAVGGASAIEETCYLCHKSSAAGGIAQDIQSEFSKPSKMPITSYAGHKPLFLSSTPLPEGVLLKPGQAAPDPRFTDTKHVECVDCHNPHKVLKTNRTEGMRGIDLAGNIVNNVINDPAPLDSTPSTTQYPVCLRCHGDTFNTVIGAGYPSTLPSGATPSNKRTEFQTTNSAFHPVGGPGRNTSTNLNAQLTPNGLNINSVIKCTDCHNSNSYEGTTGRVTSTGSPSTPVGPHGSTYGSIRRANYLNTLPGPSNWNSANFNLCFRCHAVTALTAKDTGSGARTNFYDDINGKGNLHWVHLIDRISKSQPLCKSCHYNIHSNQEAPNTQYNINGFVTNTPPSNTPTRMVNFHPNIRPISGRPRPEWWFDTATKKRQCFLQCHKPDGSPGGAVMGGTAAEAGGKMAEYRPASGDLP